MRSHRSTYVSGLLAGLALAFATGTARAEGPAEVLDGATLYATRTCIACHGADAKTPILPDYPKLAGQNAPYAEMQALVNYISGLTP
ncbi:MAG: c-type cytochrome [Deltaproteobacteria bacterium]|nr:c-type cytochrome [Deltaproteobacteria bacterium]